MSINKNHIRFVIQLIGVLIIASLAVTGAAIPSLSNSGGGSWQYQRDITISNTGGVLSDYQVLVSLTSGNFPTNAQNNGTDIRFTDVSGAELSYWIESWDYSSRTAKIWVKVTSIASGSTTIRMYYGNPSATTMSNGDGTFVFFDDFSGAVLSSKWTNSVSPEGRGSVTVSNGMLNLIANPTPGPSGTWSVGEFAQVKSTASFPLPYKLVFKYYTNLPYPFTYIDTGLPGKAECYHLGGMSDYPATAIQPATDNGGVSNGIIHIYSQNAGNPRLLTISTSTATKTSFDLLPNVFKTFEYRADSSSVKFISDGTVIASHSTNIPITPLPIMFEASQSRSGYSRCGYYDVTIPSEYHVDYVFLGKYTSSEPTVTLGTEQPVSTPVTTGTITVNTNLAGATFTLTGVSQSYSGSGTSWSNTSAPAGTYTITYGTVTGSSAPASETKTLTAGGSIAFSGTYTLTPSTPTTIPPTTIVTPTPQIIVITQPPTPQITQPTATPKPDKFRVGPSVTLRPVNDVIEENQDGIVELFMNNPSLNDVTLNVDAQVSVPAGLHVSGENFGQAAGAGVVAGTFSVPSGKSRTISIAIKADKSARKGSHTLQFTGLYYPDENKDAFQPISLTYSVTVKATSIDVTPTPIQTATPKTPGFSVILTMFAIVVYVISKKELRN
ncbi:MAG: DUF2341 domain-containing protein [Candidatus Methanoperedens sp.]|nr:DUF2341 domain-containing protein [Candidatus Methanoperedens sp.]